MAFSLPDYEKNVAEAQKAVTDSPRDLREALTKESSFAGPVRNFSKKRGKGPYLAERTICPKAQGHEGLV